MKILIIFSLFAFISACSSRYENCSAFNFSLLPIDSAYFKKILFTNRIDTLIFEPHIKEYTKESYEPNMMRPCDTRFYISLHEKRYNFDIVYSFYQENPRHRGIQTNCEIHLNDATIMDCILAKQDIAKQFTVKLNDANKDSLRMSNIHRIRNVRLEALKIAEFQMYSGTKWKMIENKKS